jgi:DNA-binding response OmpR family regulator
MARTKVRSSLKRTLVIHQDPQKRQSIAEALTNLGWHVCQASGRSDGMPILYQIRPNLVILEIRPEERQSWDIYFSIRLITDTPIILVSEHTLDIEHIRHDTPNVYVVTPLSIPKLAWVAETQLGPSSPSNPKTPKQSKPQTIFLLHRLGSRQIKHIDKALLEVGDFGEVHLIFRNGHLRSVLKMTTETLSPHPFFPADSQITLDKSSEHAN